MRRWKRTIEVAFFARLISREPGIKIHFDHGCTDDEAERLVPPAEIEREKLLVSAYEHDLPGGQIHRKQYLHSPFWILLHLIMASWMLTVHCLFIDTDTTRSRWPSGNRMGSRNVVDVRSLKVLDVIFVFLVNTPRQKNSIYTYFTGFSESSWNNN